jgi:hypothetical protein
MAMPAATVTGKELLMPYMGIPTTWLAAAIKVSEMPVDSLPNTIRHSSGSSARHRSVVACSRSKAIMGRPRSRDQATKAASSGR